MKKPYHILHTEWSDGWGGQEIRIMEDCRGMVSRGHQVELAGCPEGQLRIIAEKEGLLFHPLTMRASWDAAALFKLVKLIKQRSINIIHTHSSVDSWLGGVAGHLTGSRVVRTRHLSVPVNTNPLNFVYHLPQAVLTTGQGIRRHLVDDYGLSADRVFSVPTGIDPERFKPRPPDRQLQAELGIKPQETVIAIVAVMRSWKRHDLFCQMARHLLDSYPDLRFLIVGGGPDQAIVSKWVDDWRLRPNLIMTGHRSDVERILSLCHICVLASDQAEGVPQATLQQLAAEKAVVASAAGDVPEVVRHEQTGLLVETGSWLALAEAVKRFLQDKELAQRLGKNGRQMVLREYSLTHMLDRTEEIYSQL
jgi:glycosyltransferase involved in cell wall biosynthesis